MNKYPKGSEWRKWDLHVHSPASHGFSGTWDQFETQLKNGDCEVVGINDYFSVAGYKKLKEKIAAGTLNIGDKKILPVVEFRMRDVLKNRQTGTSGTNINFHIIFDDSIPVLKIETFIKSLSVDSSQIADKYEDSQFLKETAKVYFEEDVIKALRNNPDFQDKFIVMLPYDEYGGVGDIDPNSDDWIKRGFIRNAGILGSSNQNQIDFFLWKSPLDTKGKDKFTQEQFAEWFITKKPCIKGSDSHDHQHPIGKLKDADSKPIEKYCWIKAEPTFEGLKQIIFDPESRVFIGEKCPVQPTNVIDSITFNIPSDAKIAFKQKGGAEKQEEFCFTNFKETFYLSPFFNCFVGGRGSGKSTILNFLGQHAKDPSSSSLFWDKLQPSFDTSDKKYFSFAGVETFEFIGQSEVESFATNKEAFTNAIYERANIISDGLLGQKEVILSDLLKKIVGFQATVKSIVDLTENHSEKEKERNTLTSSVKIAKSKEYEEIVGKITEKSNQRQKLESWRTAIDELRDSITGIQEEHFDSSPEEQLGEEPIAKKASDKEDIAKPYKEAYEKAKTNIEVAADILDEKKFKKLVEKEEKLSTEIEAQEKELSQLLKKAGLSEENILQVKSAPQKLVRLDDELDKLRKKIEDRKKELEGYKRVFESVELAKSEYEKVIGDSVKPLVNTLEEQAKENKNKDIKNIGLSYFFDEQQAWKEIADAFYSYFSEDHRDGERPDLLKTYITENKEIFVGDYEKIKGLLSKADKKVGYMKFLKDVFAGEFNYKIFQSIRDSRLNDVLKYKRIQVLYDGKDIEQASFGQKCTAVMVVLLLFGNYPLIIDEPEAHLDSSLIANYLVPLIKRKKTNRQIIFATHNANFVVNGDAEKIFILKNETGKTEIIETTIENLENRDELLKLEGGREAFRKRGEKLHI